MRPREDEDEPLALDYSQPAVAEVANVSQADSIDAGWVTPAPSSPEQARDVDQDLPVPSGTHSYGIAWPRPSAVNARDETMLTNLWKSLNGAVLT